MRVALASEVQDEAEALVVELKAIEQWDAAYWRTPSPEAYETLAFVARGKSRCEILSQLLNIIPRLNNRESTTGRARSCGRSRNCAARKNGKPASSTA